MSCLRIVKWLVFFPMGSIGVPLSQVRNMLGHGILERVHLQPIQDGALSACVLCGRLDRFSTNLIF